MMAKYDADLKDGGRSIKEFQLWGRMTFILGKLLEAVVQSKTRRYIKRNRDILEKVKTFVEKRLCCTSLLGYFEGILSVDEGLQSGDRFPYIS